MTAACAPPLALPPSAPSFDMTARQLDTLRDRFVCVCVLDLSQRSPVTTVSCASRPQSMRGAFELFDNLVIAWHTPRVWACTPRLAEQASTDFHSLGCNHRACMLMLAQADTPLPQTAYSYWLGRTSILHGPLTTNSTTNSNRSTTQVKQFDKTTCSSGRFSWRGLTSHEPPDDAAGDRSRIWGSTSAWISLTSLATHRGAHSAIQTHVSRVFIVSVQRAQKTPLFYHHPSLTHRQAMSWPVAPLPSSSTSACDHTLHMCMLLSAHCCTSLGARTYVHARTAPAIVSASRHSRSLCLAWRHLCSSHLSWLDCEWQTHVAARVSERALSLASMRRLRCECSSHARITRGCNVALEGCVSPHFAVPC